MRADHFLDGLDGVRLAGLDAAFHTRQAVHAPRVLKRPVSIHVSHQ